MKALKKAWIFLLLVCLAALFSTTALADDATSGTCGDNVTWALDTSTGLLTISGEGEMENYSFYSYSDVPWYSLRKSITAVVIEDGVTRISAYAFYECSSLTSVAIPNSVTSIDSEAFYSCSSLTSVTIPTGVTSIGGLEFYRCSSLTSVAIPDSVTYIGWGAFSGCSSLTSITIPDDITSIRADTFSGCSSLTSITIPSNVASIEGGAFSGCNSLTSVSIPDSVTSIGSYAFEGCSGLTSITIPSNVASIENGAFAYCSSLTDIQVSEENAAYSAEDSVLFNKDKTTLVCYPSGKTTSTYKIPDSVTSIYTDAFRSCNNLTSVTIPDSVTYIGWGAFYDCTSLASVTIPDSVTYISDNTFSGCSSLTSVTIPDSVTSVGDDAFEECSSLTSVTIPDSITSIGWGAFYGCSSLTSVTIGNSVTSISGNAFRGCISLTSVTIPDSVTAIDFGAFALCSSLTDVYYGGSKADWNAIEIGEANEYLTSATIHYNSTGGDNSGSGTGDTSSETAGSVQSYIDYATSFNRCSYSDFQALGAKFTKGAWCVQFVTWCAAQSGLFDVIPYTSGTGTLFRTITNPNGSYQASGVYFGSSSASYLQYAERMTRTDYVPQAGDLIFLVWSGQNATLGHVGLVIDYNADTGRVSFVDGNAGNGIVKVRDGVSYSNLKRTDSQIVGYVRPNYDGGTRSGTVTYTFHCPIDVTVSYQGETLSSAEGILSASFGTMALDDDGITVVLDYGPAYDICVTGTDSGTMDVTVDYDLDSGASSASFTNIAVTAGTSVSVVSNIDSTTLVVSEAEEISEAWTATDGEAATEADSEALESLLNEVNTVEPDESTLGDLNGDGEVNASDLTVLARHVGKVEYITDETALANADVTGDGNVDASDLTKLAQYVGKIISSLD